MAKKNFIFWSFFSLLLFDNMLKYHHVCQQTNGRAPVGAGFSEDLPVLPALSAVEGSIVEGHVFVSADTRKKPIFWLNSQGFEHLNFGNLDLFRI